MLIKMMPQWLFLMIMIVSLGAARASQRVARASQKITQQLVSRSIIMCNEVFAVWVCYSRDHVQ